MKKRISKEISGRSSNAGLDRMSKSSVVICGIARDCSSQLRKLIPKLEELGSNFKSYKVVVVENDSKDDTAETVMAWAAKNDKVIPVLFSANKKFRANHHKGSEEVGDFDYLRISRIAFARNLYLQELRNIRQADFVIIVDLDIMDFSILGVASSFEQSDEWDCATSSGLRYTLRAPFNSTVYWDTYAFEPCSGYSDGTQHLAEIRSSQVLLKKKLKSNKLIPALSAFGGLAIYRYNILAGHQYKAVKNNDPEVPILCEHVDFHRSISHDSENFRLVINPLQTLKYEPIGTTLKRNILSLVTR